MALIKCPECGKDISDKVKSCPNCGYPLVEEESTQKVEISSVNLKMEKKKKHRLIIGLVTAIGVICLALVGYSAYGKNKKEKLLSDYKTNIDILTSDMLSSGSDAESLMNLTSQVWSNAIFKESSKETDKYTKSGGKFVKDFNEALQSLSKDKSVISKKESIKSGREKVDETIKKLKNPPDEYKDMYKIVMDLYTSYESVVELALDPEGSITTYKENKNKNINSFTDNYKKLQAQVD